MILCQANFLLTQQILLCFKLSLRVSYYFSCIIQKRKHPALVVVIVSFFFCHAKSCMQVMFMCVYDKSQNMILCHGDSTKWITQLLCIYISCAVCFTFSLGVVYCSFIFYYIEYDQHITVRYCFVHKQICDDDGLRIMLKAIRQLSAISYYNNKKREKEIII